MTITGTEAYLAMRAHHRMLSEQLSARAAAVSAAVSASRRHEPAVADVIAYLTDEVLPHAAAEEQTIYPAAAAHGNLIGTVNEMLAEHGTLLTATGELTGLADGSAAAEHARQIAQLFTAHAARENDVLLPALLANNDVDLAGLLAQMHARAEEPVKAVSPGDTATRDPMGALLGLLVETATELARAGQADLACRLAAAGWAVVHEGRPDLAVTVTAALHGMTRRVGDGPAQAGAPATAGEPGADPGAQAGEPDLDVRDLPPAQRHETIFAAYGDLAAGAGFVLVNDHDPKPLRYQFEAEQAGQFTWQSLEAGPEVWRVRIGRPPGATPAHGNPLGTCKPHPTA